ncbi:MAG: hypothetical protein JSR82_07530 [Verrucomicrobia bacterium]|nr:hypothetical protein [Verrucomicrobiota bacterium]
MYRPELKARLWESDRHLDQTNLTDPEIGALDVADSGFRPDVIDSQQEHDIGRVGHRVTEESPNFAPRRIRDDPVDLTHPFQEVPPLIDLTPVGPGRKEAVDVPVAAARFEDTASRREVCDQSFGKFERSLHLIVAPIVPVWLITHPALLAGVAVGTTQFAFGYPR